MPVAGTHAVSDIAGAVIQSQPRIGDVVFAVDLARRRLSAIARCGRGSRSSVGFQPTSRRMSYAIASPVLPPIWL